MAYDCAANCDAIPQRTNFDSGGSMRFPTFISAFAIALIFLGAPVAVPTQSRPEVSDADSAAIKQMFADFSGSFSRHDAHGVAMIFAEDGDFTNMRGSHSHGRADIEKWFAALFRGNLNAALRTDTVKSIRVFTPELAAVDADTVITGTKSADGSEIPPRKGLMIVLATKQNGRWLIATFHESEYPPTRGEAAK